MFDDEDFYELIVIFKIEDVKCFGFFFFYNEEECFFIIFNWE